MQYSIFWSYIAPIGAKPNNQKTATSCNVGGTMVVNVGMQASLLLTSTFYRYLRTLTEKHRIYFKGHNYMVPF